MHVAHIGLPKTGTTFLQKHYFPTLGFSSYFSTQAPYPWPSSLDWIFETNSLWMSDLSALIVPLSRAEREARFQEKTARYSASWIQKSRSWLESQEKQAFISAEGLAGVSLPVAKITASILREMRIVKVIFVFRNQADWSLSIWRQLILREDHFGRFVPYADLFGADPSPECLNVIDMNWTDYIVLYQHLFGANNVLAIPYELLVDRADEFQRTIQQFLNIDSAVSVPLGTRENTSVCDRVYRGWKCDSHPLLMKKRRIRLLSHRYLTSHILRFQGLSRFLLEEHAAPVMSASQKMKFMERFRSENRRLADLSGFDLEQYGYY